MLGNNNGPEQAADHFNEPEISVHAVEPPVQGLGFQILKDNDAFAIISKTGDIARSKIITGLYVSDMRLCSDLDLAVGGKNLIPLSDPVVSNDNAEIHFTLTNAEFQANDGQTVVAGTLDIQRRLVLRDNRLFQGIEFRNGGTVNIDFNATFRQGSDKVDLFILRNPEVPTKALGEKGEITKAFNYVSYPYAGIDGLSRPSFISYQNRPDMLEADRAVFNVKLAAGQSSGFFVEAGAGVAPDALPSPQRYDDAVESLRLQRSRLIHGGATIQFGNPQMQRWHDRSISDLTMLMNAEPTGMYPCAGLPWFSTQFGRDAIQTATQTLATHPDIAAGVLSFLAAHQSTVDDPEREAQPGKMPHELRRCETANAGLVPFKCYYGGVDTTLMFLKLADDYHKRTGDDALIERLRPNIEAALTWAEGQADANGFFVYAPHEGKGLGNQFFKDSQDSVLYEDGDTQVVFPRAVSSIQGYAYAAWKAGARLMNMLAERADMEGRSADADNRRSFADYYSHKGDALRTAFNASDFWMEDRGAYALALDGKGRPCRVVASENGELLATGIVPPDRAARIAAHLCDDKFFSGFGLRTLKEGEGVPKSQEEYGANAHGDRMITRAGFDPDSYHRGSIWPKVTSDAADGLMRSGYGAEAAMLCRGNQRIAAQKDGRLPEVASGRSVSQSPELTDYPSSCTPQAWSAGAIFHDISTMTGLQIDAGAGTISVDPAYLPEDWGTVTFNNLKVGGTTISFEVDRQGIRALNHSGPALRLMDRRQSGLVAGLVAEPVAEPVAGPVPELAPAGN